MKYKKELTNLLSKKESSSIPAAVALLTGLAVGAALGILLAPKKGTDTRDQIADGANDLLSNIKDQFASLKSKLTAQAQELEEAKDKTVENVRKKTKEAADKLTGPEDNDASQIKVPSAGTTAWKDENA